MRARFVLPTLLLATAIASGSPARGQQIPADAVLRDFEPTGEYVLEVGDVPLPALKMFRSRPAGSAVLIMGNGIPGPLLLVPRERAVKRVPAGKVVVGDDGVAFVLADAQLTRESAFATEGRDVLFTVGNTMARLREKPHLVGPHPASDLASHDVGYAFRAGRYSPSAPVVQALRAVRTPVRVRVFFGSWCPHCSETVPKVMKVGEALSGSPVQIEYYGVPSGFQDDEAKRLGVNSVPTGIVYVGGREVGRISGFEWNIPELAIKKLVDKAAAAR